ncbi:MAG: hypothetical protein R3C26_12510 [Calditrichia bacterium]
MFAGEGGPERTNRRFHYLSDGMPAGAAVHCVRFGNAMAKIPISARIFGKIGNSGVSIATLDDAKKLYSGFNC